jgi:hypothetical protein
MSSLADLISKWPLLRQIREGKDGKLVSIESRAGGRASRFNSSARE